MVLHITTKLFRSLIRSLVYDLFLGEAMLLLLTESTSEKRTTVMKTNDGLPSKKIESDEDGVNDGEDASCGGGKVRRFGMVGVAVVDRFTVVGIGSGGREENDGDVGGWLSPVRMIMMMVIVKMDMTAKGRIEV